MKTIWNYFEEVIEYPNDIADNPIPYGVCWQYIQQTFLNGFINFVKPIGCYVVNRYTKETAILEDAQVCDNDKFFNWHKFEGTKLDLIKAIVSGEKLMYHTKLSCLEDDIIILARIEDETNNQFKYMFFWFDMDVSDCCIGRFITTDPEEVILQSIETWLKQAFQDIKGHEEEHDDDNGFHKLPVSFIRGWVSF